MEPEQITLVTVVAMGLSMLVWNWAVEVMRPKRIFVVEDSDDDYRMFKMFIDLDNVVIHRYKSADNILFEIARLKPDLVIVDYFLAGKIKGDKLFKFCGKRIPAILVTGYEGEIVGIPKDSALIKSPDRSYFDKLSEQALLKLA